MELSRNVKCNVCGTWHEYSEKTCLIQCPCFMYGNHSTVNHIQFKSTGYIPLHKRCMVNIDYTDVPTWNHVILLYVPSYAVENMPMGHNIYHTVKVFHIPDI